MKVMIYRNGIKHPVDADDIEVGGRKASEIIEEHDAMKEEIETLKRDNAKVRESVKLLADALARTQEAIVSEGGK